MPPDSVPVTVVAPTTVRAFAAIDMFPAVTVSAPFTVTALNADAPLSIVRLKKLFVAPWVIVGAALVSSIVPAAGVKVMPESFQLPAIKWVKFPGASVPAVITSEVLTVSAAAKVTVPPELICAVAKV